MDQGGQHPRAGEDHPDAGEDRSRGVLAELLRRDEPGEDIERDERDHPADQEAAAGEADSPDHRAGESLPAPLLLAHRPRRNSERARQAGVI